MKQIGFIQIFLGLSLMVSQTLAAKPVRIDTAADPVATNSQPAKLPLEIDWAFSGLVRNENGELYNYYFQMQRKNTHFHVVATLINAKNQQILVFEDARSAIDKPDVLNWHVGQTFMQFNPINNSWVFGVKTKDNNGFNFKVDLLQADKTPESQFLRSGVELSVSQTGRLNGHLQLGNGIKEQFVTAPKAWFKQVAVYKSQSSLHPLTGVLCQFDDGSGFYSVNLREEDALRGAIAGWRDEQGASISMSQFVSIKKKKDDNWLLRIQYPKVNLTMKNILAEKNGEEQPLIAGVTKGDRTGFCTISHDSVGDADAL